MDALTESRFLCQYNTATVSASLICFLFNQPFLNPCPAFFLTAYHIIGRQIQVLLKLCHLRTSYCLFYPDSTGGFCPLTSMAFVQKFELQSTTHVYVFCMFLLLLENIYCFIIEVSACLSSLAAYSIPGPDGCHFCADQFMNIWHS